MSITCLPQGSSLPTHKPLLFWHRWDKIDQLPNPCPRTPLLPLVTEKGSLPLGNLPLILVTTDLAPRPGPGHPGPGPRSKALWHFAAAGMGAGCTRGTRVWGSMLSAGVHPRAACASASCPPAYCRLRVKSRKKGHHKKRSLYVICTRPGHTNLQWPRNTVEVSKTNAEWILLPTGTVVTPREVFKNCPDSFLSGRQHG